MALSLPKNGGPMLLGEAGRLVDDTLRQAVEVAQRIRRLNGSLETGTQVFLAASDKILPLEGSSSLE